MGHKPELWLVMVKAVEITIMDEVWLTHAADYVCLRIFLMMVGVCDNGWSWSITVVNNYWWLVRCSGQEWWCKMVVVWCLILVGNDRGLTLGSWMVGGERWVKDACLWTVVVHDGESEWLMNGSYCWLHVAIGGWKSLILVVYLINSHGEWTVYS